MPERALKYTNGFRRFVCSTLENETKNWLWLVIMRISLTDAALISRPVYREPNLARMNLHLERLVPMRTINVFFLKYFWINRESFVRSKACGRNYLEKRASKFSSNAICPRVVDSSVEKLELDA